MKKIIAIIAAALCALTMNAQDSAQIISKIEKANSSSRTVRENFSEVMTPADKSLKQKKREGVFEYKPDYFRMDYSNNDLFLIENNVMTLKNGAATQKFDLTKNLMMKGLSNTLMYAFQGQLTKLAVEQNADITASRDGNFYLVTLKAKKKAPRGYSQIVVYYRVSDCMINSMRMDEFTGASTYYSIAK